MPRRLPVLAALAALVVLAALAVLAVAASPADTAARPDAVEPAPPPGYCRVRPAEVWPAFGPDGSAPDLTPFQDYRAGLGIDGSARGAGVTIADIEYEWRPQHTELAGRALPPGSGSGLPPGYRAEDHGTAVLGILGASEDGRGVTGLAPDATLAPRSPLTPGQADYRPWEAVTAAARTLGPGDVMLIELQAGLDAGAAPFVPIEVYGEMRTAIRAAVDKGIVVVEPAGNGGGDIAELLAQRNVRAPWLLGPSAPDHSGALIVSGGGAGTDDDGTPDRARVPGSNSGARIDVQGYGAAVVTSGYGDSPWSPGGDGTYTACFDGTSSAAATIAGAAAVVQSAEIARDGTPLTPAQLRDLLVATGTEQSRPADGHIGPRPFVAAAIASLGDLPPPPPPSGQVPPPASSGPVVPAVPPVPPPVPAAPAVAAAATPVPAARALRVGIDRARGRLTLRLRGLAPRAVVRVGARRVRVVGGRAVLRRAVRGTFVVRVSAPSRSGAGVAVVAFRVTLPARGAARVVRLRT